MTTRRDILCFLGALPVLSLVGCGDSGDGAAANCSPIMLTDEHDCALCGMTIVRFPGPKGQACRRDGRQLTFCSVSDLLSWAWQPENAPNISGLFVHNLSETGWEEPSDDHWIDARDAWYVIGHDRRAAMGHSPAPFTRRDDAKDFAARHGGEVFQFDALDWDLLRGHAPS